MTSTSSPISLSLITAGVAAVSLVFSFASIVNFVLSIVVPLSLMSNVGIPADETTRTEALTSSIFNANGVLKYPLLVPTVRAVIRSDIGIIKTKTSGGIFE